MRTVIKGDGGQIIIMEDPTKPDVLWIEFCCGDIKLKSRLIKRDIESLVMMLKWSMKNGVELARDNTLIVSAELVGKRLLINIRDNNLGDQVDLTYTLTLRQFRRLIQILERHL